MLHILPQTVYMNDTRTVAKGLLGKFLVMRKNDGEIISCMITEVEAYDGFHDKASHASRGKTARNKPMFEKGGIWYVYFVYGMYDMLNIVAGPKGYPAAVLIRGVEGCDGPGKLTRAFGITRAYNGKLATKQTGLWIEDRGIVISKNTIKTSSRIGVVYAGPVWSKKKYRFFLENMI